MGIVVICSYKPKNGGEGELLSLLKKHGPALKEEGLITDRETTFLKSDDGVFVEIFEWKSEEASRGAHENAQIGPIWKAMAEVAEFVPMSSVAQAQTPFAHFEPIAI